MGNHYYGMGNHYGRRPQLILIRLNYNNINKYNCTLVLSKILNFKKVSRGCQ